MTELLEVSLKASIVLFMVGNLLAMGLVLKVDEALAGLKDFRFLTLSIVLGFIICPGIAWLLATVIPMEQSFATGLILIGLVPCAPFLPVMVEKAKGDIGYTAAFMLLISVLTVIYMPIAVPLLAKGLSTDAWTIAKPLIIMVLIPLAVGAGIHAASSGTAIKLHPIVKKTTGLITVIMLILCVVVYGEGFLEAIGTYAIGAQILFYIAVVTVTYALGSALPVKQKSVLTLGMCTRNLGAAFAPLFAVATVDERAIIMVALGVPLQTLAAVLVAVYLG